MEAIMSCCLTPYEALLGFNLLGRDHFAHPTLGLNFGAGSGTESMSGYRQFLRQFTRAENLDPGKTSIGEADGAQGHLVDSGTVFKTVQRIKVDWNVINRVLGVVKSALGNTADKGHLATFKTNADGTAGTGCLALSTTAGSFSMTTGFTLTDPFAAVFSARTVLKIV